MSAPHTAIIDPAEIHKLERRLAKDAKTEEKGLKHATKDVKKAEKTENKATKVVEKADKKVEKAKAKEAKLERAMNEAINKHNMAVSDLQAVTKEDQIRHDQLAKSREAAQTRKSTMDKLEEEKMIHDKQRLDHLGQLKDRIEQETAPNSPASNPDTNTNTTPV